MEYFSTKRLVFSGLCIAISIVLPLAFHSIPNAGNVFLPMHIPVLLCGLVCGWPYGLSCGILAPLLSSLITGMPPAAYLPSMLCELAIYGMLAGVLQKVFTLKKIIADIYIKLIASMIMGRIVYGLVNALFFQVGEYSFTIWLTSAFITALPGIVIQLILIPLIIISLKKAKIIEYV
ncbi:MAG: ECF transporter S component [Christensenellales bacterium]